MRARWHCLIGAGSVLEAREVARDAVGVVAREVVGVKDNIDVRGMPTTNGTHWQTAVPARDAHVTAALRGREVAIVKTNMDEFAFGGYGRNPTHGDVINTAAPERITGGSSSGSAAAVAGAVCDWALGTDTGGSVRIPAALCGVVGVKPTLGLISTDGVRLVSPTLDTVGDRTRHATLRRTAGSPASDRAHRERSMNQEYLSLDPPMSWVV